MADRWKLIRKYAGAQTEFTGSGVPGEDGVGANRAIKLKDRLYLDKSLIGMTLSQLNNLIIELKKLYAKLKKDKDLGKEVPGDVKGVIHYHDPGDENENKT
tara:strand:- start:2359 stop:2661 length:303 start_codon:yes stop_codon:yes gene_type:complete